MSNNRLLLSVLLFITVIPMFCIIFNLSVTNTNQNTIIGEGNLKIIRIGETTYLANESQDLAFFTDERKRGYLALDVKVLRGKKIEDISAEKITLNTDEYAAFNQLECLLADQSIVSCDAAIQHSPDNSKLIVDLGDGIWLLNIDGTQLREISRDGYSELINNADQQNNELKYPLIWALNPVWIDNNTIAFTSSRNVYPNGYTTDIWEIDVNTGLTNKLVDGTTTHDELHVIYADELQLIIWGGISKRIFHYSLIESTLSEHKINGVPISVSNSGEIVLYQTFDTSDSLMPDISSLELNSGKITTVKHSEKQQIYNGAWNSNLQFAFYSQSFEQFGASVYIYDYVNQTIIEPVLPDSIGLIVPHSAISWLNENELLISAGRSSWSISIK